MDRETLAIDVNASGSGTMTARDTPGFNRQYSVSFSDDVINRRGAATSTGNFSFLGLPVGGTAAVEVVSPTEINYTETTTYSTCAATYRGKLTHTS